MGRHQRGELRLDGAEMSRLDFQQDVVANDVDDESIKGHFESIARLRVPLLE